MVGRAGRITAAVALIASSAAVALGGCGSSSQTTTTVVTVPGGPSAGSPSPRQATAGGATPIVTVEKTPIAKATLEHWMAISAAISHAKAQGDGLKNQILGFLITSQWVVGEAAHLGITVSEAQAHTQLRQETAKLYPTASKLKRYLASIGETEADVLMRVKDELLKQKISQRVTGGKTASTEPHLLLSDFQKSFETRWRARTSCQPGYVMEDCKEYRGTPPTSGGSSSADASSSSSSSSSSPRSSSAANSNASGEIPVSPGTMTLSSPAFERNGEVPAQYTCDGADISPPLQWQHLPAHTAELVLFVIDDSSDGSEGGIRWMVAGIEPSLSGVSAGQTPPGALVGRNGAGKATYGGICPPRGKRDAIEFVLWALSKKIPLSNGFVPAVAEHDYSRSELASATDYATYTRP
jgi:Raf kinase inhibitor-like YbhB/YbcL family protein